MLGMIFMSELKEMIANASGKECWESLQQVMTEKTGRPLEEFYVVATPMPALMEKIGQMVDRHGVDKEEWMEFFRKGIEWIKGERPHIS